MLFRSLYAYACAYRIDTVVVAFYGDFGAFARYACYGADIDQAVVYFRYLKLEQTDEEEIVCTAYGNLGVVVFVVYIGDHGAYCLALAEEVAGDSLALGEKKLVLFVVEKKGLAAPCLIDFAGNKLAFELFEFVEDGLFLQVEDTALQ